MTPGDKYGEFLGETLFDHFHSQRVVSRVEALSGTSAFYHGPKGCLPHAGRNAVDRGATVRSITLALNSTCDTTLPFRKRRRADSSRYCPVANTDNTKSSTDKNCSNFLRIKRFVVVRVPLVAIPSALPCAFY